MVVQREFKLRLQRHLAVFDLIKTEGPISIPKLTRRWTEQSGEMASEKTIQRDIRYLCDRRFAPIEYDGSRKGWVLTDPAYRLETIRLTEGELLALVIAERALDSIQSLPMARQLEKTLRRLCAALDNTVSIEPARLLAAMEFTPQRGAQVDAPLIEVLGQAIAQRFCVEMDYTTAGGEKTKHRVVRPLHLRCHQGDWYLVGRYEGTDKVPILALQRMRNVRRTNQRFEEAFDPKTYFRNSFGFEVSEKTHHVRIRFDPKGAFFIRERAVHPEEKRKDTRDGGLVLEFPARRLEEVQRWVLGWGSHAHVLAPARLVAMMEAEVRLLETMYPPGARSRPV